MPHYLRGYCERAETATPAGGPLRFVASTEGVGRDGYVIDASAWQLDAYRANPAVLWSHDYTGQRPPIGRAERVWSEGGRLMADIVFDQNDPFARQIEDKYRSGMLNAVSVGWDTLEIAPTENPGVRGRITRAELLDISAVSIPGDPAALMERQRRALAGVGQALLDLVTDASPETDEADASADWTRTAAAMAALFGDAAPRPEAERQAEYRKLAREYERAGRTAPEYLPAAHCAALSGDELRGLFFEGEPAIAPAAFSRAGAVLSARNLNDLEQAVTLIQTVVQRARKESDAAAADATDEPSAERAANDVLVRLQAVFREGWA